jgi:hypothetical protein
MPHMFERSVFLRRVDLKVASLATLLLLFLAGVPAEARQSGDYRFTTVIDSARDGLVPTRCAAINTLGTVTVQVSDTAAGFNKLVTKRGAHDAPVVLAHTQPIADYPTFCDNGFTLITSDPSINELGEVAFQGNLRRITDGVSRPDCQTPQQTDRPRQGVFLGKGSQLTTIAHTNNQPGGSFISEFLVADTAVNGLGKTALVIETDDGDAGLFVGSKAGTFETRFLDSDGRFETPSSRVSINVLGQIAFEDSGIFLSNPNGTFTTIVDSTGGFGSAGDPALNNLGRVAFTADRFDEDFNQIFSVNTSRGAGVTVVAESSPGGYAFFDEPALNDFGKVVFTADVQPDPDIFTTIQGVFTGPDPVTDKVLQQGDFYEGVPVTSVLTCSEAINNRGQIVMSVISEDPDTFEQRRFVVKATPRHLLGVD